MAFHTNQEITEDILLVVKNTFACFQYESVYASQHEQTRRVSVPPSAKLCGEHIVYDKLDQACYNDSDDSTDAHTDISTFSECGTKTPMSLDNCGIEEACTSPLEDAPCENLWLVPPPPMPFMAAQHESPRPHLSPKADVFQPQMAQQVVDDKLDSQTQVYKNRFAEVVATVRKNIMSSDHVAGVELCENDGTWCLVLKPCRECDETEQVELLMDIAKDAFLEATSESKCVYLMGYCSPKPFEMQPHGFQATLGAMENAKTACWHVFKKGFCRHGDTCSKTHAACEVPVRVLVESSSLKSTASSIGEFKQDMANLAMAMTASLEECPYADKVEAFKDKDHQGWTVEVTPKEELKSHKDYLLMLAKNIMFTVTERSNNAYIMGYAKQPFIPTSRGFVAMIGDVQDESATCWDLFSEGTCCRGCSCRWQHPECLMPVNVVVKERSTLKCSPAMLEYLASQGLISHPIK